MKPALIKTGRDQDWKPKLRRARCALSMLTTQAAPVPHAAKLHRRIESRACQACAPLPRYAVRHQCRPFAPVSEQMFRRSVQRFADRVWGGAPRRRARSHGTPVRIRIFSAQTGKFPLTSCSGHRWGPPAPAVQTEYRRCPQSVLPSFHRNARTTHRSFRRYWHARLSVLRRLPQSFARHLAVDSIPSCRCSPENVPCRLRVRTLASGRSPRFRFATSGERLAGRGSCRPRRPSGLPTGCLSRSSERSGR